MYSRGTRRIIFGFFSWEDHGRRAQTRKLAGDKSGSDLGMAHKGPVRSRKVERSH